MALKYYSIPLNILHDDSRGLCCRQCFSMINSNKSFGRPPILAEKLHCTTEIVACQSRQIAHICVKLVDENLGKLLLD